MEEIQNSKKSGLSLYKTCVTRPDPGWFQKTHLSIMELYRKNENIDLSEDKNPEEICNKKPMRLALDNINNHKWRRVVDIMRIHYKKYKKEQSHQFKQSLKNKIVEENNSLSKRLCNLKVSVSPLITKTYKEKINFQQIECSYDLYKGNSENCQSHYKSFYLGNADFNYRVWERFDTQKSKLAQGGYKTMVAVSNKQAGFEYHSSSAIFSANAAEELKDKYIRTFNIFRWIDEVLNLADVVVIADRIDQTTLYAKNAGVDLMKYMQSKEIILQQKVREFYTKRVPTELFNEKDLMTEFKNRKFNLFSRFFHIKNFKNIIFAIEKMWAAGIVYTDIKPENIAVIELKNQEQKTYLKFRIIDTDDIITLKVISDIRDYPIKFSAPYISKSLHDLLKTHRTKLKEKLVISSEDYSKTREIMRLIQLYALMVTISTCYCG